VIVELGDFGEFSKTYSAEDIAIYAKITGDANPIHLSDEKAVEKGFKSMVSLFFF